MRKDMSWFVWIGAESHGKRRALVMMTIGALLSGMLLSLLMKSFLIHDQQVLSQEMKDALELEEEALSKENKTMENELLRLKTDESLAEQAAAALSAAKVRAGLTGMTGPGVVITLNDSDKRSVAVDNHGLYLIHEEYLREVVNALWNGGAEAVSINDQRLNTHTGIMCSGSTILINNVYQSAPYVIKAIGNPKALSASLDFYYWQVLLSFQEEYGITCDVKESEAFLSVPAAKPVAYRYAEPVKEG